MIRDACVIACTSSLLAGQLSQFHSSLHIIFDYFFSSSVAPGTDLEDELAGHRLKYDDERKYGTIPTRIYLLYLRACGIPTLVVFFMSTLMWQALRVYTDVWLRDWTENEESTDVCVLH